MLAPILGAIRSRSCEKSVCDLGFGLNAALAESRLAGETPCFRCAQVGLKELLPFEADERGARGHFGGFMEGEAALGRG